MPIGPEKKPMPTIILVVEDDETLRWLMVEALTMLVDTQVIDCNNADNAKILLTHANNINLVVTDIRMPGEIDGLELAQMCWKTWPTLPVIITSGHCRIPIEQIPQGSAFMAKPWSLEQLYKAVDGRLSDTHRVYI